MMTSAARNATDSALEKVGAPSKPQQKQPCEIAPTATGLMEPAMDWGWRTVAEHRAMKVSAYENAARTVRWFLASLPPTITIGNLNAQHIRDFLATQRSRGVAPVTLNKYRRHLMAMFGAQTTKSRARFFRDDPTRWFSDDVESLLEPPHEIVTYSPHDVMAFLQACERAADPNRKVKVSRRKRTGKNASAKVEQFE